MKKRLLILATLASLALSGCAPKVDVKADKAAIRSLLDESIAAENASDLAAFIATHADDAISLPPENPPLVGKEAIRAYWLDFFDRFNLDGRTTPEEIQVVGDWAFLRGVWSYTLTPKGVESQQQSTSSYILIVQRQPDGSWKWARLIWNSDQPAPGAATE